MVRWAPLVACADSLSETASSTGIPIDTEGFSVIASNGDGSISELLGGADIASIKREVDGRFLDAGWTAFDAKSDSGTTTYRRAMDDGTDEYALVVFLDESGDTAVLIQCYSG